MSGRGGVLSPPPSPLATHVVLAVDRVTTVTKTSLLTLNMYLSVGHKIKFTKQLKCTLNNRAVSLKHVHMT